MHSAMQHAIVQSILIIQFFQYIQGTIRPLNTKLHSENAGLYKFDSYFVEKLDAFPRTDKYNAVDGFPRLLRARRQNAGNNPEAYSFTLTGDDRRFAGVLYSGEGSQVIYLLTFESDDVVTSSALYRSTDYGRNFTIQSDKLPSGAVLGSSVYRFDKNIIFADANTQRIYVTTNEGATYDDYTIPVNPEALKTHPTMPGWILGYSLQGTLMYSENYGASWNVIARNVFTSAYAQQYLLQDFNWGVPGIDWDIDNPSQSDLTKVFYSVIDPSVASYSYNDRILYVAHNPGSGYISKVFDPHLGYIYSYILDYQFIYADHLLQGDADFYDYYGDDGFQLHVSYMRNPFNLTRIPTHFEHYMYYVGSHRSSQSLIIVQHYSHYSLYLSDETGTYYTLSLSDIAVSYEHGIDLAIIESIDGTMLANQAVFLKDEWRNRTMITFDNGASWQRIGAPSTSSCLQPTCSLHFHLYSSSRYSRIAIYSRNSAPGIIVAHGNPGSYLTDDGSVYITRDGGLTWERALDFTWHVEIIDHGALLVAAKDNHQDNSRTIRYSCDEGVTWTDFNFINRPIVAWGIVTEPGETTTQVMLFGTESQIVSSHWIVTHINFTSIFPRTCQASDYYQWTVSDGRIGDQQCLLGETRIIERRKPNVCCWNSRQYERVISTTPCECTAADFECEWGYYRDMHSQNCLLDENGPKIDCLTGYRKIPGNRCYGGVSSQYLPPSNCSLTGKAEENTGENTGNNDDGNNSNTGVIASVTVVVVLITLISIAFIIAGIVIYLRKRNVRTSSTAPTEPTVIPNSQDPSVLYEVRDQKAVISKGTMDYQTLYDEKTEL